MRNGLGQMPALRELQRQLAAAILSPGREERVPGGTLGLEQWVVVPAGASIVERVAVYVDGYPARVQEALREVFPALAHIAGSRAFAALTERYIAAVPLRSYNLNDAGENLADFLRQDELGARLPLSLDLAALEWRVARAFHATARPPIEPSAFATWDLAQWDRAVLHFQPSVAIVRSVWPIREVWEARETPREEIDIDLQDRPDNVFVRRCGLEVECTSIDTTQADVLQGLLDGRSLGEVSSKLLGQGQDVSEVSAWFAGWMQAGLIVDCTSSSLLP